MECGKIQKLLSAYHDDEISGEQQALVAQHTQACPRCRGELATFEQMSHAAKRLDDPEPPERIWAAIEGALDADRPAGNVAPSLERTRRNPRWRPVALLVAAASILIAITAIWMATIRWHGPGDHHELTANFDQYLDSFSVDPVAAQNLLLTKYDHRPVNVTEAAEQLGYQPAVAQGLPSGYSVKSMFVLDMPCCKCLKTVCRRDDGKLLAIFEHADEQPIWFGDRPRIDTQCNGRECSVIGVDRGLVASWKSGTRQLTVVGARDLEEITELVEHLQSDAG